MELDATVPVLPASCANCGETAGQSKREPHGERVLIVPYCTRCFRALEREDTRRFAAALSSLLVASTILLTWPRLWPGGGAFPYAAMAVGCALLPLVVLLLLHRAPEAGQSHAGRALWWQRERRVACTNALWAEELARKNDTTARTGVARERLPWALFTGPLLACAVAPLLYSFQYPELLVLNLGSEPIRLVSDDRAVAEVPVTSLESPASGVRLRLPAGARRVRLLSSSGQLLLEEKLVLSAGRTHLYAPLSVGHCFWLEQDAYGQAEAPEPRTRALPESTRFWTLPLDVDTWFASNPDPSEDARSSGGTLTALRHAPCESRLGQGR